MDESTGEGFASELEMGPRLPKANVAKPGPNDKPAGLKVATDPAGTWVQGVGFARYS